MYLIEKNNINCGVQVTEDPVYWKSMGKQISNSVDRFATLVG
jgi:hypothetical protein